MSSSEWLSKKDEGSEAATGGGGGVPSEADVVIIGWS